ncbi:MAG TPA: hypothetical protein VFN80_07835 [Acidothermaceae bacterium]|nr:hypothetical protein [Acidothermaceae bacterium]
MDAVAWAEIISPVVSAVAVIAVIGWVAADRRRAERQAAHDRWEIARVTEEDRRYAELAANRRQSQELVFRVALAFERHQAGDKLALAETRTFLLAVGDRLPVTRAYYLGTTAWQPDDGVRIEAFSRMYNLPVGPLLARRELQQELQGVNVTIDLRDGQPAGWKLTGEQLAEERAIGSAEERELKLRLRRMPKHARV